MHIIFQKGVDIFKIEHNVTHANFWLGMQYPLKEMEHA